MDQKDLSKRIEEGDPCCSNIATDVFEPPFNGGAGWRETQQMNSLYSGLSILKQKTDEVESFMNMFLSQENQSYVQPADHVISSMALSSMANLMPPIVHTATHMMQSCQWMAIETAKAAGYNSHNNNTIHSDQEMHIMQNPDDDGPYQFGNQGLFLDGDSSNNWRANSTTYNSNQIIDTSYQAANNLSQDCEVSPEVYQVVEIDAADLLASYTHYCQVCGRGFKRDANLRMHMRSHGDQYKSIKKTSSEENKMAMRLMPRKYSCPQEGCRYNKQHVKFQPLKSIVCVRNHYKRSHCPKMFMCNKCNVKQFAVLSDLKAHEKHCGDIKWQCSCGATFSLKDKLMDHVAFYVGHTPLVNPPIFDMEIS